MGDFEDFRLAVWWHYRDGFAWRQHGDDLALHALGGQQIEPMLAFNDRFPGLFRNFAELETTPQAVLAFANDYGPLFLDPAECPLSVWNREIELMRQHVATWEALQSFRPARLRAFVNGRLGPEESQARRAGRPVAADARHTASVWLAGALTQALDGRCSLIPSTIAEFAPPPAIVEPIRLHIFVKSLRDALWLQFALAVHGNQQFWRCGTCGKYQPITASSTRAHKAYCSDACRLRAFRQRHRTTDQASSKPTKGKRDGKK